MFTTSLNHVYITFESDFGPFFAISTFYTPVGPNGLDRLCWLRATGTKSSQITEDQTRNSSRFQPAMRLQMTNKCWLKSVIDWHGAISFSLIT
jgi:hypothetical protein